VGGGGGKTKSLLPARWGPARKNSENKRHSWPPEKRKKKKKPFRSGKKNMRGGNRVHPITKKKGRGDRENLSLSEKGDDDAK